MIHEQEVQKNGMAAISETISTNQILKVMGNKVSRYKSYQFFQRVYVQKGLGSELEQKERAIDHVKENVLRLQSHQLSIEEKQSSSYRKCYICPDKGCPWKGVILLVCKVKLSPSSERDLSLTYSGWVVFSGSQGTHTKTKKSEVKIISGFEDIPKLFEEDHVNKFNLIVKPVKKDESAYKIGEQQSQRSKPLELEYGLKAIWEIKQIVRMLQTEEKTQDPNEILEKLIKYLGDLQEEHPKDEVATMQKFFKKAIKDAFYNMQIEGFHQQFDDMSFTNSNQPEIIVHQFTPDSKIEDKSYILKLNVWSKDLALKYLESTWKTFCKVNQITTEKFILPWIHPSIDFSCDSEVKVRKRLCRINIDKIKSLKEMTYRKGRKETVQDVKQDAIFQSIANLMEIDVNYGNADFNTVPDNLMSEKEKQMQLVSQANKEVKQLQEYLDDVQQRLDFAKANLKRQENLLANNDQVSKQWLKLAPTVIAVSIKSQEVKVDQVEKNLGMKVQQGHITCKESYKKQFALAKDECIMKLEELPATQSTAINTQTTNSEDQEEKDESKQMKKDNSSQRSKRQKKQDAKDSTKEVANLVSLEITDQVTMNGQLAKIQKKGFETTDVPLGIILEEDDDSQINGKHQKSMEFEQKQLNKYKQQQSPRARYDSLDENLLSGAFII